MQKMQWVMKAPRDAWQNIPIPWVWRNVRQLLLYEERGGISILKQNGGTAPWFGGTVLGQITPQQPSRREEHSLCPLKWQLVGAAGPPGVLLTLKASVSHVTSTSDKSKLTAD